MTKSFYIIDGHAQIYAAYYAPLVGNLTAPDGEPTKVTLIFTSMILKLLRERKPDMICVTMDAPGPTFRHEMFPQYKANRPPMPEDLPQQIERIEEILAAMRITVLRKSGYEADDLIGTLTREAQQKKLQVHICSKDKDLEQLIDENTVLYDPRKDVIMDVPGLLEAKGIRPEQVIDVMALTGDTSDNVPGVPDVGPKTAQQWIQKYGSLKDLLEHRDEIKGKRGDNLRANIEQLQLAQKLVTIDCDVPFKIDFDEFEFSGFDQENLEKMFRKLNFSRLLSQIKTTANDSVEGYDSGTTNAAPADYILVDTQDAFDDFYRKLCKQKVFAIDTETTGINPVAAQLVGLSFSWQAGTGYYLPIRVPLGQKHLDQEKTIKKLTQILIDPEVKKIGQNIKYDCIILRRAGVELKGVDFDTMVASYILDSTRISHGMDSLALDYLNHETVKLSSLIGKGKKQITFDLVDTQQAVDYAAEDADITWRLYQHFNNQLTDKELRTLFRDVEMPLVEVLADMEYQGIALDIPRLKKLSTQISGRIDELTSQIRQEAGCEFNLDSPKQLSEILFGRLGLQPVKKTKTGSSTDQEVLETLRWQHPIASLMLEYRQLSKLKNTYVDKLPSMVCADTRRVHASFNQTVAATGRLSSSNPNLQNIPIRTTLGQEIRRAFVPQVTDGAILAADYSQIELRLLAHFSKDEALKEAFEKGEDIHRFVAAQVYDITLDMVTKEQRGKAKAVNFGIIYGQTAYGLSRSIGMPVDEAQRFIDDYFGRYPQIRTFMDNVITNATKDGYVKTILGRRRAIPELTGANNNRRRLGERMAVNTVVQGSAADMIKIAMINIYKRIRQEYPDLKMLLQVHDELVFELPKEKAEEYGGMIKEEMETAIKLEVPIIVEVGWGANWLECK
jgi:DNA polymerase I